MIDFRVTEEQAALRDEAERMAREVYAPVAQEWDYNHIWLPDDERRRLGEMGYLGLALPQKYGGGDGELLDALIALEAIGKHNLVAAFQVFECNTGPIRVVDLFGTEEQKRRYIPPVAEGSRTMALSISEPDAGSAATDLRTKAELDGSHYVVNGTKRWCSGAGHAEDYLVYVRLDDAPGHRGIGALVIDGESEGVTFGPQETLMGFHGVASADIAFENVRVPKENLIVPSGGFKKLFSAFAIERMGNATMSLAMAQGALDKTARYVEERQQFGKPLVEFQAVQMALADMILRVEAMRTLNWRAASNGKAYPDALEASVAKCHANEAAKVVTDLAMQLHGGYGYHSEYDVERHHRDAHGWAIAGGTPSMQRIRIVSEYLGRRFDQRS